MSIPSSRWSLELRLGRHESTVLETGDRLESPSERVLVGVGGEPRRSPGAVGLGDARTLQGRRRDETATFHVRRSLGDLGELRFGGGRDDVDLDERREATSRELLWGVGPARSPEVRDHALVRSRRVDGAWRSTQESAHVEHRLRTDRLAISWGLRWQDGSGRLDEETARRFGAREEWLPRLAVAYDPRGLGQERLTFGVAALADGLGAVAPQILAASGTQTLEGVELASNGASGRSLFTATRGAVELPERLASERATRWTLGGEHLLLPGLVVGAGLRYTELRGGPRFTRRGAGWTLVETGSTWPLDCASATSGARLHAEWRGSRGSLSADLDWSALHGTRSASCLDDRLAAFERSGPVQVSPWTPPSAASGRRLNLLGSKRLGERLTLGGVLLLQSLRGSDVGLVDVVDEGLWLSRPETLAAASRSLWSLDLALHYRLPFGDLEDGGWRLSVEALNVFDGRSAWGTLESLSLTPDLDGIAGARDPRGGGARAVQGARSVRLLLAWRW